MREVYIVDAVRTPVGRMGGTLKNTQAHEMGGLVCKALMERTGCLLYTSPSPRD